jgi:hypothetical protein
MDFDRNSRTPLLLASLCIGFPALLNAQIGYKPAEVAKARDTLLLRDFKPKSTLTDRKFTISTRKRCCSISAHSLGQAFRLQSSATDRRPAS